MKKFKLNGIVRIILVCFVPIILYLVISACCSIGDPPVKTAVFPWQLENRSYIICRPARTTGYEWYVIVDENGRQNGNYCLITGADPTAELGLGYPFYVTKNRYVFYVEDRKEYYSEEIREDVLEYTVSGWDIVYPVRHGDLRDLIPISGHILESDCMTR